MSTLWYQDAALLRQEPSLSRAQLGELRSSMSLAVTRSQLETNRERLHSAQEVLLQY